MPTGPTGEPNKSFTFPLMELFGCHANTSLLLLILLQMPHSRYCQWKITMVTQQCDEATGRGLTAWQCQTQVCHEEPRVYPHTEPWRLATEGNPPVSHQDFDPCVTSKRQVVPLSGTQRAPIIICVQALTLSCEIQIVDESL